MTPPPLITGTIDLTNAESVLVRSWDEQPPTWQPDLRQDTTVDLDESPQQHRFADSSMDEYSTDEVFRETSVVHFDQPRSTGVTVDIPQSTLIHPKSLFKVMKDCGNDFEQNAEDYGEEHEENASIFVLPPRGSKEWVAVKELQEVAEPQGESSENEDFLEFELNDFTIYVDSKIYPNEMRPLHHLATKTGNDTFYFDGTLSFGETSHRVTHVRFQELPLGNYGIEEHTVDDQLWVRSFMNARARKEIYYRLGKPAVEYARFHQPFLWVADLAKHVIDYCEFMTVREREVTIACFKAHFNKWLWKSHGNSPEFQAWHRQFNDADFRRSLAANVEFIWKEACGALRSEMRRIQKFLIVFKEIHSFTRYRQSVLPAAEEYPPTIVTPYILECFGHMKVGEILSLSGRFFKTDSPVPSPQRVDSAPLPLSSEKSTVLTPEAHKAMIHSIEIGDVISTIRDGEGTDTNWKKQVAKGSHDDDRWFGLVQNIHENPRTGRRTFDVTWLYRPVETPCCQMKYPWNNELFLSNHCTCQDGKDACWDEDEVLNAVDVKWFGNPNNSDGEFFVRQTYMVEDRRWITLQQSHLQCSHGQSRTPYKAGDTVLVDPVPATGTLQPFEIVKVFKQRDHIFIRLRKLLRRRQVDPEARPNELLYTDEMVVVRLSNIVGRCYVRFFNPSETILPPYNFDGTGNFFYILAEEFPSSLRQGFNPSPSVRLPKPKLKGLDLFCGGGNFGRGLEDGGAVEMRWANDIWDRAIHTYLANAPHPDKTHPFLGSIDDLLDSALAGKYCENVPRPGEVDFISAGSPCPGFSKLTVDQTTRKQLKNRSLVASFAAFVDFYRPKFGVLENVKDIVPGERDRHEDIFSQLMCAIVGMGYQTQLILGDAYCYGSPQNRPRVFLYFAAEGEKLPEAPLPSHSTPPGVSISIGKICNGEPYVKRAQGLTAFEFVSALGATSDLPSIQDAKADICIPFPDHRVSAGMTPELSRQIAAIPNRPRGMNFAKAWNQGKGVMTAGERALFPPERKEEKNTIRARVAPTSKAWGRARPHYVFNTITTTCHPSDARIGWHSHWADSRPLTVMEVRRAQGFPDQDVILGNPATQWKIVGNSVARQVAVALGLQFREAWFGSLFDDADSGVPSVTTAPTRIVEDTVAGMYQRDKFSLLQAFKTPELSYSENTTPAEQDDVSTPVFSTTQSETGSRKRATPHDLVKEVQGSKKLRIEGADDKVDSSDTLAEETPEPYVSRAIIPGPLPRYNRYRPTNE